MNCEKIFCIIYEKYLSLLNLLQQNNFHVFLNIIYFFQLLTYLSPLTFKNIRFFDYS